MSGLPEHLRTDAARPFRPAITRRLLHEAATEIERLMAWKAEAIEVLAQWEEVAELVPMQLGAVKSHAVRDWVQKVQESRP